MVNVVNTETKEQLRTRMQEKLKTIPPLEKFQASIAAANSLKTSKPWKRSRMVMLYASMEAEMDTSPLIQAAWDAGKSVCLPVIKNREAQQMEARFLTALERLVPGPLGFRQPDPMHCPMVEPSQIDLMLVPGLAFDCKGGRLGRGAGFYDQFLSLQEWKGTSIGYFFAHQEVDEVPMGSKDVRLDGVVTERKIFQIS